MLSLSPYPVYITWTVSNHCLIPSIFFVSLLLCNSLFGQPEPWLNLTLPTPWMPSNSWKWLKKRKFNHADWCHWIYDSSLKWTFDYVLHSWSYVPGPCTLMVVFVKFLLSSDLQHLFLNPPNQNRTATVSCYLICPPVCQHICFSSVGGNERADHFHVCLRVLLLYSRILLKLFFLLCLESSFPSLHVFASPI